MIKHSNLALVIFISLIFSICSAQKNISNKTKSSIEIRADISKNMSESKLELNKVFENCIEFLNDIGTSDAGNYKSFLIESQNGWEKYMESKCRMTKYQSRDAAQGGLAFYYLCRTELNNKRKTELKILLKDFKFEFNN